MKHGQEGWIRFILLAKGDKEEEEEEEGGGEREEKKRLYTELFPSGTRLRTPLRVSLFPSLFCSLLPSLLFSRLVHPSSLSLSLSRPSSLIVVASITLFGPTYRSINRSDNAPVDPTYRPNPHGPTP